MSLANSKRNCWRVPRPSPPSNDRSQHKGRSQYINWSRSLEGQLATADDVDMLVPLGGHCEVAGCVVVLPAHLEVLESKGQGTRLTRNRIKSVRPSILEGDSMLARFL